MKNLSYISFDGAIGDTLGLTALSEYFDSIKNIDWHTELFGIDIFQNNPNIKSVISPKRYSPNLEPCRVYSCNIIQSYCNQLGLEYNNKMTPKLYFTDEELVKAKNTLADITGKVICLCLKSSADSRDVRYENLESLIMLLKKDGFSIVAVGKNRIEDPKNLFTKNLTGNTTLREVFSVIKVSDCYLGVDTGLFHVAAACGIPQFVFFRNNGCSNNAYHNTYFIESNLLCPDYCHRPGVAICEAPNRCMDCYNYEEYYTLIKKVFNLN
jgi:ADP-heptose:LPS heptosyltransferase